MAAGATCTRHPAGGVVTSRLRSRLRRCGAAAAWRRARPRPLSTRGEFESKYFEFQGVRLPPFCRGKMEEIADFPAPPSDVCVVTYPKSGRSLS
ncbi:sulfotransferase 4A1-like [Dasypus novemcinctus]|uniref:sulfotransferase 4A1-like n=1 Tax=Dasypus novemcinctus TaxID=9361 RepID=UPI0039C9C0AF